MENLDKYWNMGIDMAMEYAPKVLLALITLFIGLRIIKFLVGIVRKRLEKSNTDETLRPFITNLVSWALKIMLFISVASMLGVATTSFVAVLGAAGLAIGLALQGSLANFAGGALLLLFRPYRVGDLIESQGRTGTVKEIQIFNTIMVTPENHTVVLPNGAVSNGDIVNYTALGTRRVDLSIGVAYDADIKKAKDVLMEAMSNHPKVLKDPAPYVGVSELGDSAVNLVVRPWCNIDDYWDVYFGVLEDGKNALDQNNISIPFPQMDVHLDKLN